MKLHINKASGNYSDANSGDSSDWVITILHFILMVFNAAAMFCFAVLAYYVFAKSTVEISQLPAVKFLPSSWIDLSGFVEKILFLTIVGCAYLFTFGLLSALVNASVHITELRNQSLGLTESFDGRGWFNILFGTEVRFFVIWKVPTDGIDESFKCVYSEHYGRVVESILLLGTCEVSALGEYSARVKKRFKQFVEQEPHYTGRRYEGVCTIDCFRDSERFIENTRSIGTVDIWSNSDHLSCSIVVSKQFFSQLQNKMHGIGRQGDKVELSFWMSGKHLSAMKESTLRLEINSIDVSKYAPKILKPQQVEKPEQVEVIKEVRRKYPH